GNEREKAVTNAMPEVKHAMRSAEKATAEDSIRAAIENRPQQFGQLGRIVLEVGILNDNDVAGCLLNSSAHGCALALIVRLQNQAVDDAMVREFLQHVARAVCRAVIYTNDFDVDRNLANPA